MERIISTKNCDPTTRSCSLLEQHLDFITAGRRCFEKMLEPVCATIDCEFKARDEEDCASMVRPINVRMYGAGLSVGVQRSELLWVRSSVL